MADASQFPLPRPETFAEALQASERRFGFTSEPRCHVCHGPVVATRSDLALAGGDVLVRYVMACPGGHVRSELEFLQD